MWHLPSTSGVVSIGYKIVKLANQCTDCEKDSPAVCTKIECQFLCWHMYKCDEACYDYNNGHICRHIHCIHSSLTLPSAVENPPVAISQPVIDEYSTLAATDEPTHENGEFKNSE